METEGYVGLAELRQRALDEKKPFDYDQRDRRHPRARPLHDPLHAEGAAAALHSRPWPAATCTARSRARWSSSTATRPRRIRSAPGPFKLVQWRRSSLIVFETQPRLPRDALRRRARRRRRRGPGAARPLQGPPPADGRPRRDLDHRGGAAALALVRQRRGRRRLPRRLPVRAAGDAERQGRAEPRQAAASAATRSSRRPAHFYLFNMDDPVVGGYTPAQVALRRAIGLGIDSRKIIDYAYNGLGTVAQGPTLPHTTAYDPKLKTECGDYDPARARALLDLYGFVDRDGDGWRERPDGSPLVLRVSTQSRRRATARSPRCSIKNMKVLGIRIELDDRAVAGEPEGGARRQLPGVVGRRLVGSRPTRAARSSATTAGRSAARTWRASGCRRSTRSTTASQTLPDGPERLAAFREAERIGARLHAVQVHAQPRLARHDAEARDRLPPAGVLAGLVAVRRHRRRRRRRPRRGPEP